MDVRCPGTAPVGSTLPLDPMTAGRVQSAPAAAENSPFQAEQKKELAELRNRLAAVMQCVPEGMRGHPEGKIVLEAQALLDRDSDMGCVDSDLGFYEDVLDDHIRKCDAPLDIIQQRMERYCLPNLSAEEQRKWKMLFVNPTTNAQKIDISAALKKKNAKERLLAQRRLENERCAASNKALQESIDSLERSGDSMGYELQQNRMMANGSKLTTEQMQVRLQRVYNAIKLLDIDDDSQDLIRQCVNDQSDPTSPNQGDMQQNSIARFRALLHHLIQENERMQRVLDLSKVRTALYSVNLKAMALEIKDCWGTGECVMVPPHTNYFDSLMMNLQFAKEHVHLKPNPSIHCVNTSLPYQPIGQYSEEITQQIRDLVAAGQEADEISCSPEEWSPAFIDSLALEFSKVCLRSSIMAGLMNDLEDLNRCPNEVAAFTTLTLIIEKTVQCHMAYLFLPMKNGSGYWARVHGTKNIISYTPNQDNIVTAAFKTGTVHNIGDVYTLSNFDKSEDLRTGYRTKAVMCVPIRTSPVGPIASVIQVINKVSPSASYFNDLEAFLLHVIGSAYMQVTLELQLRLSMEHLSERKDILVAVAEQLFQKRKTMQHKDFLMCVQDRLTQLFSITNWAIILVGDCQLERLEMGSRYAEVVASSGLDKGFAGICVAKKTLCHYENSEAQERALIEAYRNSRAHRIDIESAGRLTLWPIVDLGSVISIIEFAQSPDDTFTDTDEYGFNPEDPEHIAIMEKLFAMFQYFIEKFWPRADRFLGGQTKKRATAVLSSFVRRSTNVDFQGFSVFSRLIRKGGEEDWVDQITALAAKKIQRMFRSTIVPRISRRKSSLLIIKSEKQVKIDPIAS